MKGLTELNQAALVNTNGGASFAYRIGQAFAILLDIAGTPAIDTVGGIQAANDWFC